MKKQILVLAFDINGTNWKIRKRVWRGLLKIDAELKYKSHWTLPYNKRNLDGMKTVCNEIKKYGGKAELIRGEKIA